MDYSNFQRGKNFKPQNNDRQGNYSNGLATYPASLNSQFGQNATRPEQSFYVAPYKMNRIKQALETVYRRRKAEAGLNECIWCGTLTKKLCSLCGAPYCSRECQMQDWERHYREECVKNETPSVQNRNFPNFSEPSIQRNARSNSINSQQNFGIPTESTISDQDSQRQPRTAENDSSMSQFHKNQGRDNNKSQNYGQKDNKPARGGNKFQNKHSPKDKFNKESNRKDAYQSNRNLNHTEDENWDTPCVPQTSGPNKDVTKESDDGLAKSFNQMNIESPRKKDTQVNRKLDYKVKQDDCKNKVEDQPKAAEKKEENIEEQVYKPSLNTETKLVENQKETNTFSDQKAGTSKKLEKPIVQKVVATIAGDDGSSYYVCSPSDSFTFVKLHESLQEQCQIAKSIEPKVGIVCACFAENEWYRGKITNVENKIKFKAIDFGPVWDCDDVKEPLKELPEELAEGPGFARLLKFNEKLPSDLEDGDTFLVEILEKFDEFDAARFVKKVLSEADEEIAAEVASAVTPETATAVTPEVAPETASKVAPVNLILKEDTIVSGSTVIVPTCIGFNSCFVQRFEVAENELKEIGLKANEYAETGKPFQNKGDINVGDFVCARFTDDGCFYRAKIMSKTENIFKVRFVDYGNLGDVSELKDILPLPEQLKCYPQLAIAVKLKNITTNVKHGKEYDEVAKYLDSLCLNADQLVLTYEGDINNGVTLKESASGNIVNEFINKKLSK